ncbi:MAG: hybrid sensor histidine kinase/response regulator [Anaerolineales bacterium]|nr:hybrid sensor histidine kinase/response regulator [Anaerolineales bacterium]MCB0014308.1 hybrid sensor histidine kinase/response regulator [Anaerolineales bacterium]MCB0017420.1 hybrid sensor histidine kinase/response regulator [Anaerolineales bacterium]
MSEMQGTILIVDDNLDLQEITADWLEWRGHKVVRANNGRQALEKLEQHTVDLMLLDISMPVMDGYQVLQQLRDRPLQADVPIVVMSAIADMDSIVKCIELGAADYLTKPIKMPLFWARVNTLLENKRARDVERQLLLELKELQQIDRVLNASLNLNTVAASILEAAMNTTGAVAGLIFGRTPSALRYHVCAGDTNEEAALEVIHSLDDIDDESANLSSLPLADKPRLAVSAAHRTIMLLYENDSRKYYMVLERNEAFAEKGLSLLARIAAHATLAFQNAQLYSELDLSNKAKQHVISFVAHELNTPLTALITYIQLVSQTVEEHKTSRLERYLGVLDNSAQRMAKMVAELNDIARIESGKMVFKFDSHDAEALIDEVVALQRTDFASHEHLFSVSIPETLPRLWGDRDRVAQILTNLLSNACKYTPNGGQISLEVRAIESEGKPFLRFAVQDSGIGISDEDKTRIFKQFVRANDSRIDNVKGLGLGLSITRTMVVKQGGQIWVESEMGKGSTFYFTIPANVESEAYVRHTSALDFPQTAEL